MTLRERRLAKYACYRYSLKGEERTRRYNEVPVSGPASVTARSRQQAESYLVSENDETRSRQEVINGIRAAFALPASSAWPGSSP